jgi:putative transposase
VASPTRRALIDRDNRDIPLRVQATLLSVSRSSLYYQPCGPSPEEVAVKHRIDAIFTQWPFYGSRRITAQVRREGVSINRKAVQRHLREMGLAAIAPGPNLSRRHPDHCVYPYLLRGLPITRPNQVWGIDITYIRLQGGWMYLVAILDWFTRYVVSWEVDQTLEMPFVLTAVERALQQAQPEIINSDQGSHFTSPLFLAYWQQRQVQISMDSKGRALDNIFTERLWRTIKYENVYLQDYQSPREARCGLADYLTFYNHQRLHQALAYRTPAELYLASP